jgi:bacteriocin-type transport-associated protein
MIAPDEVPVVKQLFADFPHFSLLQESDLDWILASAHAQTCQPGTPLLRMGQSIDSIYIPTKGNFETIVTNANGTQEPLTKVAPGEVFGETVLDNRPAAITLHAAELSEVLVLSKQELTYKLDNDRDFAARFYHLMSCKLSDRLRELSKLMAQRQIKEGEPLRKVLMMFATLNDSDVAWMIANGTAEKASIGTNLIEQEKSVPAVYLLLDGMFGIYVSTGNGKEIEVAKRVKGDILGEMSFVDGGMASATVKALQNAWFLSLPRTKLSEKLKEDRAFASRFYRAISQVLSSRYQSLLLQGGLASMDLSQVDMLSEDIEVEDEIDLDVLEGTAIAGTRFDWMIQRLRR